MARIVVTPDTFHFVAFDAARITELAAEVADALGCPADLEVRIEVDERIPLGRVELVSVDPVVLSVQGSAFEDAKKLRQLSERAVVDTVGRWLVRALDRRSPAFADAPTEADLTIPQAVAWTASCAGRCERAGYTPSKPRWQYHFRNRHAFTDAADALFEQLWNAESPSWADIAAASEAAAATRLAS